MNTQSELENRLPYQRHGYVIGIPPPQAICSETEGPLGTVMARIVGNPSGTSILGFDVDLPSCRAWIGNSRPYGKVDSIRSRGMTRL
jgi:hypothetical protein